MSKVDKKLDDAKKKAEEISNRLMSNAFHAAIQKGRIMGRMEAQGKSVEEIAKTINVPVESVRRFKNEDPFEFMKQFESSREENS